MTAPAAWKHTTVLLTEAVEALVKRDDGVYVDGTFGRGGHSRAVLQRLGAETAGGERGAAGVEHVVPVRGAGLETGDEDPRRRIGRRVEIDLGPPRRLGIGCLRPPRLDAQALRTAALQPQRQALLVDEAVHRLHRGAETQLRDGKTRHDRRAERQVARRDQQAPSPRRLERRCRRRCVGPAHRRQNS